MPARKGSRIHAAIYLDEPKYNALRELSHATRVPVSAYLREAVDDLLAKHKVRVARPSALKRKP